LPFLLFCEALGLVASDRGHPRGQLISPRWKPKGAPGSQGERSTEYAFAPPTRFGHYNGRIQDRLRGVASRNARKSCGDGLQGRTGCGQQIYQSIRLPRGVDNSYRSARRGVNDLWPSSRTNFYITHNSVSNSRSRDARCKENPWLPRTRKSLRANSRAWRWEEWGRGHPFSLRFRSVHGFLPLLHPRQPTIRPRGGQVRARRTRQPG